MGASACRPRSRRFFPSSGKHRSARASRRRVYRYPTPGAIVAFVALGPAHLRTDFLRTGVDRYVAQWVGVGWLAAGALLAHGRPAGRA
jgi:hypothetical protein